MDGFHIRRPQSAKEAWVSASHACVSLQSWFRGTLQYVHQAGLPSFFPVRQTNYNENFEFLDIRLLDLPLGYNWWYIRSLGRKRLQHQTRGKILIKCCWTYFYNIFLYINGYQENLSYTSYMYPACTYTRLVFQKKDRIVCSPKQYDLTSVKGCAWNIVAINYHNTNMDVHN